MLIRLTIRLIYCGACLRKSMVPGNLQRRELLSAVMNRYGSLGMLYKRVIALPIPAGLLMHLHFNFYAFVDRLNHRMLPFSHNARVSENAS